MVTQLLETYGRPGSHWPRTTPLIFARAMTRIIILLWLAAICQPASAQTLEQSLGFVLSSGLLDPAEIKTIDNDVVPFKTLMTVDAFNAETLRITNRPQCIARIDGTNLLTNKTVYKEYFINNVILDETKSSPSPSGQWMSLHFLGEETLVCETIIGGERTCSKSFAINFPPLVYDRIINALKYVYSTFCTPAKRKSAF